ncbi:OmpA family protein [Paraburkholderia unamae]|uniref:YMGG-like glycine zipper-containing protein n=1 Tax=Paraburkholderia unamae TaxID=219649 RepID=UPI000DC31049|nr:YMGG-like glycine zipper-containing protein [Paraburkholderia unamae]RAR65144.1 OmpA family protein [Paraburkholderia unamae]
MKYTYLTLLAAAGLLSACAVVPTGPSVMALPGTGKTFDQFRADDFNCRQFAFQQVGGVSTNQAATASGVGSAVVGTALGAAAGAAFGGGQGAAIGAGAGLLAGSAVGMGNAQGSSWDVQRRYDYAYLQCMYASGNRIPAPGNMVMTQPQQFQSAPQQRFLPPPPPGSPPPPPSGY